MISPINVIFTINFKDPSNFRIFYITSYSKMFGLDFHRVLRDTSTTMMMMITLRHIIYIAICSICISIRVIYF